MMFRYGHYVKFPPGSGFLVLPSESRRAALSGLALYEAATPLQRLASAAGSAFIGSGLHRFLPEHRDAGIPWAWWEAWVAGLAERQLGPIKYVAFRVPAGRRLCALLMDRAGLPVGFAKSSDGPIPPLSATVRARLTEAPPPLHFRIPRTIVEGQFEGLHYVLFEPLPEGRHRSPPPQPTHVHAVIDEIHDRLVTIPRPEGVPPHHAVCHSGFTPRNVRVGSDGRWWIFDWEGVDWAPRLSYELRYWSAEFAYRLWPNVSRATKRVLALLRQRGTDEEIVEAVQWPRQSATHRPIERDIHRAVAAAVRAGR